MAVSATLRGLDRLAKKRQTIQIAKKQIDLDDASYRALLQRAAGVTSSTQLNTLAKADAVLDALSRLGFAHKKKPKPGQHPGTHPKSASFGAPHTLEREPLLHKIEALLADLGLPWAYADKIAENITGGKKPEAIKRLAWVPGKALRGVIAQLEKRHVKLCAEARAILCTQLAALGLTGEEQGNWCQEQIKQPGIHTADNAWHETLQTLARLTILARNSHVSAGA